MKKFLKGFVYAANGVRLSLRERNMRVHSIIALFVICSGLFFDLTKTEWIEIFFAMGLVFSAETFNTAIERITNVVRDECKVPYSNPKLGETKDLAAGAVLIASIAASIIGLEIFVPYVLSIFSL